MSFNSSLFIFLGFQLIANCFILVARSSRSIDYLEIDTSNGNKSSSKVLVPSIEEDDVILLASNEKEKKAFYYLKGNIFTIDLVNGKSNKLGQLASHNNDNPSTIDYDWISNNFYIGVQGNHESSGRIEACSLKNITKCTVVLSDRLDYLYSLVLDPPKGKMMWQSGVTNRIEMGSMDGRNHERSPFSKNFDYPSTSRSLSIHWKTNRLFFIQSAGMKNEIIYCELTSARNCSTIIQTDDIINMAVSEKHIIWSMSAKGFLIYCEIDNCEKTKTTTQFQGIENFIVIDQKKIAREIAHNCLIWNGGCSDFCLIADEPNQMRCACPVGVALEKDDRNCKRQGIQTAIFVSSLNGIFKISLDTTDHVSIPMRLNGNDKDRMTNIDDIEYDSENQWLYWIEDEKEKDEHSRLLKRCKVECSQNETVLVLPSTIRKIRIDEKSKNLIWLDEAASSRIGITSLTSFFSKTIIFGIARAIKSFAVYHKENVLLLARDDEKSGVIEKFDFDGNKISTLKNLPRGSLVSDINMDNNRSILYWIETISTDLKWMNLESGKDGVIEFNYIHRLPQLSTIEILGTSVFINSLLGRSILHVNLDNLDLPISRSIETPIFGAKGMKAINMNAKPHSWNRCHISNGNCEHLCLAISDRVHSCHCADGYFLNSATQKCTKFDVFGTILHQNNLLSMLPISNINDEVKMITSDIGIEIKSINSISVDPIGRHIFIAGKTSASFGMIAKIEIPKPSEARRIDEIQKSTFLIEDETLKGIFGIVVDYISENIYWSNSEYEQIEVCDKTGKYRKVLAWKQIKPRFIELDLSQKSLIYYDANLPRSIKKMSMSGDSEGGIEIVSQFNEMISLAVDSDGFQVYWIEVSSSGSYLLSSVSMDGNGREMLYVGKDQKPIGISLLNGIPYYIENKLNKGGIGFYTGQIMKDNRNNLDLVKDIRMVDVKKTFTPADRNNKCFKNQARCQQLCLDEMETTTLTPYTTLKPYREVCSCSDHYLFDSQQISKEQCKPFDNLILASKKSGFYQIGLRRLNGNYFSWKQDPIVRLPIRWKFGRTVKSFGYHPSERLLFWIENHDTSQIHFANIDDPSQVLSVSARSTTMCSHFHSLAVDVVGNQIYASCYANSTGYIVIYKILDTIFNLKYVDVLVSGDAVSSSTGLPSQPKDIAIFPLRNLFFYVDVPLQESSPSSIVKCTLDAKKCSIWLSKNVSPVTRLQADPHIENSRLFYTNSYGVWSRDLASSESNIEHHYGSFSIGKDYAVAPIDEKSIIIARIDSNEKSSVFDWPTNQTVWDLANANIIQRSAKFETQSNICKKAQCSHMCRYVRDKDSPASERFECLCPPGTSKSNANRKLCVTSVNCLPWQFACLNGRQCIHSAKKCDGVNDCSDHSDESLILCKSNSMDEWPCDDSSGMVNRTNLCDGFAQCLDASDELHCRCERPHEFFDCGAWSHTNSKRCVPRVALCDRVPDCENGEDEIKMMCLRFGALTPNETQWIYFFLLIIVILLLFLLIVFCCARNDKQLSREISVSTRNEASTLLHATATTDQIAPMIPVEQMMLQNMVAYSVSDSTSTCEPLPRPHSIDHRSSVELPPQRFYAPPPSTASMSTYGVVKPSEIRFTRNLKGKRKHTIGPSSSEDDEGPRTSTPRNTSRSKVCRTPNPVRPPALPFTPINSSNAPHLSSSLSSHSSDNARTK